MVKEANTSSEPEDKKPGSSNVYWNSSGGGVRGILLHVMHYSERTSRNSAATTREPFNDKAQEPSGQSGTRTGTIVYLGCSIRLVGVMKMDEDDLARLSNQSAW